MICQKCGFKNHAGTGFCRKCGRTLKKLEDEHQFTAKPKNKFSILILLMVVVIGFSGVGSVQVVAASSLSTANIPSTTVSVEEGFSGTVTIKDPIFNVTSKQPVISLTPMDQGLL